ncbi:kelch-like protein 41 [Ochlerotatus camptorhynchus]|uniref:kelch-like protein 41 n=1 Tax=Ochlerotatus camptorhynchus TaxID=644619 RepID=UPI0031D62800
MTPLPVKQMCPSRQEFVFGLASPVARQEQLLLSEYLSDVVFQVGSTGQLMHAHKLILTVASEVFFAQFNGGFDEAKQDNRDTPIIIEDIESAIFTQVLRYIYCEKVDLTPDNIMDIYCASEKYLLTGLNTVCTKFLKTTLNVENVLKVFNDNRQYGFANVDELCLSIISDNPIRCFQSEDFLKLRQPALELIAACRAMNCQKDQLCTAIQEWCKANDSKAVFKPQLEALLCDKLYSFSTFRYDDDVSTDLKINVKGKMHLHGLGVFIGSNSKLFAPTSVDLTVQIKPWNVIVNRSVCLRKNLYIENILFEKLAVTNECRIIVTLPKRFLFCLEQFHPVDTQGALELTVTDMKLTNEYLMPALTSFSFNTSNQPPRSAFNQPFGVQTTKEQQGTNCVAYLLYSS